MVKESQNFLIKDLVNRLRDVTIDAARFRAYTATIAKFLCYEAAADLPRKTETIPTWIGEGEFAFIDQSQLVVVAILRAALPMQEGLLELFPKAKGGFLAMKRDETTFKPILYYERLPKITGKILILVDPMLATGGSLCDAIALLKTKDPAKIISLNIIAAPEGVDRVKNEHPEAALHIAQIDDHLNDRKYIIPGLGDAGDRAYNTEEE